MIRADKWPRAGIGRTGWHIDGSFQEKPFAYSIYHIISVPEVGATVFAPLSEVLEAIPAATRAQWERLHMVGSPVIACALQSRCCHNKWNSP